MKGNFFVGLAAIVVAVAAGLAVIALRSVGASPTSMALPVAYNGAEAGSQGPGRPAGC